MAFSLWVAALGNILIEENLRKRNIILVSWCCMRKRDEETVDYLLLYCPIARDLLDLVFALYGVE